MRHSTAQNYVTQTRAHLAVMASAWGLPEHEIEKLAKSISPTPESDGSWSITWSHPAAPQGRAKLGAPTAGSADFVLRHALANRTNYGTLRGVLEELRSEAGDTGLTVIDESHIFGYDILRCIETGAALAIVSAAGMPQPCPYVLYLWAPNATTPEDVSARSAEEILREFVPTRMPIRQLLLEALKDVNTPVPSSELRSAIKARYKRTITPRELTTVVAKEPQAFKKNPSRLYLAPALDENGRPVRGWYSRSDWDVAQRIVPTGHTDIARQRAVDALAGKNPQPWNARVSALFSKADKELATSPKRARIFGLRGGVGE